MGVLDEEDLAAIGRALEAEFGDVIQWSIGSVDDPGEGVTQLWIGPLRGGSEGLALRAGARLEIIGAPQKDLRIRSRGTAELRGAAITRLTGLIGEWEELRTDKPARPPVLRGDDSVATLFRLEGLDVWALGEMTAYAADIGFVGRSDVDCTESEAEELRLLLSDIARRLPKSGRSELTLTREQLSRLRLLMIPALSYLEWFDGTEVLLGRTEQRMHELQDMIDEVLEP